MVPWLPTREAVPETLLGYDQWLCWRTEERDGKSTKIPIDPETGEFASTTDPETWASFETAREQVQFGTEDGLGFVFTDHDPIVGINLDDCRDPATGTSEAWARDVIETLDSYTEVSPSGTGFHVLVEGDLPSGRNRKGDIELYETARFFTVTADHVEGAPVDLRARTDALEIIYEEYLAPDESTESSEPNRSDGAARALDDDELLQRATEAANGEKFARLWRGDTSGYESHSEADMALCSMLAFWTGGDPGWMDQLFRDSGLMREKWDEQHFADGSTYGEKTIERAIAGTSEFYKPSNLPGVDTVDAEHPTIDPSEVRRRETDRLERIEELQQRLDEALEENERLQQELEAERARRKEIEAELETEGDGDSSLFGWR